jgi:hypothetical protein
MLLMFRVQRYNKKTAIASFPQRCRGNRTKRINEGNERNEGNEGNSFAAPAMMHIPSRKRLLG